MANKPKPSTPKAEPKPKKEKISDKVKEIIAVPIDLFTGMFDDIFITQILPRLVRFGNKPKYKEKAYFAGWKLGVKANDELDRILKNRGEIIEDPVQTFLTEFVEGFNCGCDVDEGAVPKYPHPAFPEDAQ